MSSISSVDGFYKICQEGKVTYHFVNDDCLRSFSQAVTRLRREASLDRHQDLVSELARLASRLRFELSSIPATFKDICSSAEQFNRTLQSSLGLIEQAHPNLCSTLKDLMESYQTLSEGSYSPMLDRVVRVLRDRKLDRCALITTGSRYLPLIENELQGLVDLRNVKILTPMSLRGDSLFEEIILVGAARWFPDFVFTAPRSARMHVVAFEWSGGLWRHHDRFLAPVSGVSHVASIEMGTFAVDPRIDEVQPETDQEISSIEYNASRENVDADGHRLSESVKCRLYALYGGAAVFLEVDEDQRYLVVDLDIGANGRVRRVPERDLEAGMYVVLRNDDSNDYIRLVADALLGHEAEKCRSSLEFWKTKLRIEVERYGTWIVSSRLQRRGSARADEANLRNWMSPRRIAPQNKEDFDAILRLVGIDHRDTSLWMHAEAVRKAHHAAGQAVRRELLEQVREVNTAELVQPGRMDFTLAGYDGVKLTAFRIENRSDRTISLPESRVGKVFQTGT